MFDYKRKLVVILVKWQKKRLEIMYVTNKASTGEWTTMRPLMTTTEPEWTSGLFTTTLLTTTAETTTKGSSWYPGSGLEALGKGLATFFKWFGVAVGAIWGVFILGWIVFAIMECWHSKKRVSPTTETSETNESPSPRNSKTLSDEPPLYDDLSVDIVLPKYDDCNNTSF